MFAVAGMLRRRREPAVAAPDPRAEELRRKLDESRALVEERHPPKTYGREISRLLKEAQPDPG